MWGGSKDQTDKTEVGGGGVCGGEVNQPRRKGQVVGDGEAKNNFYNI